MIRTRLAVLAVVGGCVLAVSGCGGGADGGSPSQTAIREQASSLTQPETSGKPKPDQPSGESGGSATQAPHAGVERLQRVLGPFRECLSRHGVEPEPFLSGAAARQRWQQLLQQRAQRSRPEFRADIQARIACIPELPPRLRAAAEQLKRRYEQRNG